MNTKNFGLLTGVVVLLVAFAVSSHAVPAPDPTFSGDGIITVNVSGAQDSISKVAVLPDGSVLAAGTGYSTSYDLLLAKYDTSGAPVSSFGTAGKKIVDYGKSEFVVDMQVLSSGSILVLMKQDNTSTDFLLTRYTSQGQPDLFFGTEVYDFAGYNDAPAAVGVQSTGKIVVAGTATFGVGARIGLVRYNAGGGLDTTFGVGGQQSSGHTGFPETGAAMLILDDDSILVAGTVTKTGNNMDFFLAKYTAEGQPDTNFGQNGAVSVDFSGDHDILKDLAIQNNKILLAGYSEDGNYSADLAMARFDLSGDPDPDFGTSGKVRTDFSGNIFNSSEKILGIAVQTDQKIVVTGSVESILPVNLLLGRYTVDGDPDHSFSSTGFVTFDYGGNYDFGFSVALQSDGKIIAAGNTSPGADTDGLIVRFASSGAGTPGSCSGAAFCDLFDSPGSGPVWTFEKPSWSETGGQLVGTPSGKKAIAIAPYNWVGSSLYAIQTGLLSSGGDSNAVSVYGWYVDKKNMIELQMKQETGKWILKHKSNGVVVSKGKGAKAIQVNQMYSVKMTFDGSAIKVYVDDFSTPLITMPVAASVQPGTVGFSVKKTTGKFESIRVDY